MKNGFEFLSKWLKLKKAQICIFDNAFSDEENSEGFVGIEKAVKEIVQVHDRKIG